MILKYKQALRGLFTTGTSLLPNASGENKRKGRWQTGIEFRFFLRNVLITMRGKNRKQ